ncbi:hypothetical protein [Dichotomicrobium thermohalophilum]|uniref:hypothetical protein n=1 Tax=Dichotomicrobium thermohalophilum TaxID=933063 RepID=UPI0011C22521|nr:hypothetical protein [Dichotomicrobium thermohalophilum]
MKLNSVMAAAALVLAAVFYGSGSASAAAVSPVHATLGQQINTIAAKAVIDVQERRRGRRDRSERREGRRDRGERRRRARRERGERRRSARRDRRAYRRYRRHRRRDRGPRFRLYIDPRLFVQPRYYGRRYGGRCAYWHRRCVRNWGYGNANYYGCMRYHGCR